jgi:hypothetical protein
MQLYPNVYPVSDEVAGGIDARLCRKFLLLCAPENAETNQRDAQRYPSSPVHHRRARAWKKSTIGLM